MSMVFLAINALIKPLITIKGRFRERQKQIKLARDRGEKHMVGYDGN